ncbi:hypothetical protein [Qipengyuania sp. JC766]|uniref:hypothetical protein n=1 Tax=Qipengyuania sp. JC766 TaxID=3232139 RepID=UPI003458C318
MKNLQRIIYAMPDRILDRSGSIFYSAPAAFEGKREIYILGLNSGGDPAAQQENTIRKHYEEWAERTEAYSSYVDEIWEGSVAGAHGMQPRIRHLAKHLGIDLRLTPSSNVVFVRSATEAKLEAEKKELLDACWPVHQAVIDELGIRSIICLGKTAGWWVRERLGAHKELDSFQETNKRGWWSTAHLSPEGKVVCTLTHPGRVDWSNPDADPAAMVERVLRNDLRPQT